ncbi:hypothetical protein MDA_GLEAN10000674 [Myotis davidii]|uniref:Uncharacterized protein n=1 Tax=Myotis davidii TaxID=225400 RepID=L5M276_MYODS|nr:hypothetical protein MDA_GLEAN10000674 [Myotis davidii]
MSWVVDTGMMPTLCHMLVAPTCGHIYKAPALTPEGTLTGIGCVSSEMPACCPQAEFPAACEPAPSEIRVLVTLMQLARHLL